MRVQSATQPTGSVHTLHTHVQTRENVRVQSATQSTASVQTVRMSKPVITFVLKVPRSWLLIDVDVSCTCCTHDRCNHQKSLTELIENLDAAAAAADDDDDEDDDDDDEDEDEDDDDDDCHDPSASWKRA